MSHLFPFGSQLKKVEQKDKTPKEFFVLGVYASAVHAKWKENGKIKVKALAVASEPEIFWRGGDAEKIISQIKIPQELGQLVPADNKFNGPSGQALDNLFLKPFGIDRKSAWLCDLLPESRVNPQQRNALNKYYTDEIICKFNLPKTNIPDFNKSELDSDTRRQEILQELKESRADKLVLLGDLPIYWFLRFYSDKKYSRLAKFGETSDNYGQEHEMNIDGRTYKVIPLCHPRQANRLGKSSNKWGQLHVNWINKNLLCR